MPLSQIARNSPYSAKYLNLPVRQGKLEAHKEGWIWLSSHEAPNRYLEGRERKRLEVSFDGILEEPKEIQE